MVKIIDQLLPDVFYSRLSNILDDEDRSFNWFWNNTTAGNVNGEPLDSNFMFTHLLYNKDKNIKSPYFETFFPIVYFLEGHIPINNLYRMKLNLYPNQGKKIIHAKHIDLRSEVTKKPLENCTITILNFTTCNGGTIIGEEKYLSQGNQALSFDNKIEHQGFTQTDTQRRIVLNIATTNTTK
tara:strand:- start:51 stop:596 length:546 start_codon:yes stop_codon:yes gene_type:complete